MDPYIGTILLLPYNFAPYGWAFCDGSSLPINGNETLFTLLGTQYGGDGQNNFNLPDLRSRVPIHFGQGSGLPNYALGATGGNESSTVSVNQLPSHSHSVSTSSAEGNTRDPSNALLSKESAGIAAPYSSTGTADVVLGPSTGAVGSGNSHPNIQPYLALNYCIATQGVYPTQN